MGRKSPEYQFAMMGSPPVPSSPQDRPGTRQQGRAPDGQLNRQRAKRGHVLNTSVVGCTNNEYGQLTKHENVGGHRRVITQLSQNVPQNLDANFNSRSNSIPRNSYQTDNTVLNNADGSTWRSIQSGFSF